MTINKINSYKAITGAKATDSSTSTPTTEDIETMLQKLYEAKDEIEKVLRLSQYLDPDQKVQAENHLQNVEYHITMLEHYLQFGEYPTTAASGSANSTSSVPYNLEALSGWVSGSNGDSAVLSTADAANAQRAASVCSDGTYMGTIYPQAGELTNLWFVPTSSSDPSKNVVKIEAKSVGDDIVFIVSYGSDKDHIDHKEMTLVKGAASNSAIQIGVIGLNMTHGIEIDMSRVMIVDKLSGKKGGMVIIGSNYDDNIIGSWGNDMIHGAGGSDTLEGLGGEDEVYGYAKLDEDGNIASLEDYLGTDDGDTIYDIFNNDYVNAGGNVTGEDKVYTGGTAKQPDLTAEVRGEIQASDPTVLGSWFSGMGWTSTPNSTNTELVVQGDASSGDLNINIGDPNAMVSAEKDGTGNDLILTIVTVGENGPTYKKVRIQNYFNRTPPLHINVNNARFFDMNGVNIGGNTISINGTGESGDIIVGPMTILDELGVDASNLGTTRNVTQATLHDDLEALINNNSDWSNAHLDTVTNEIVFDSFDGDSLDIPLSVVSGEANAFVQQKNGDTIITIVTGSGDTAKYRVIRLKVYTKELNLTINNNPANVYRIGGEDRPVTINGGDGTDFVAGYQASTTIADSEGFKFSFDATDVSTQDNVSSKTYEERISALTGSSSSSDLAKLDALETEIKNNTAIDDTRRNALNTTIKTARTNIITKLTANTVGTEIETLAAQYLVADSDTEKAEIKQKIADKIKYLYDYIKAHPELASLLTNLKAAVKWLDDEDITLTTEDGLNEEIIPTTAASGT